MICFAFPKGLISVGSKKRKSSLTFLKETGFTLVEVQIAILILLLIMAVLMGGLQLAGKSIKAAEKIAKQSNNERIVTALLKRQISGILPLQALHNGKTKLVFSGESNEIYYTGYLPEHVVKGGPWLIHLYEEQGQLLLGYKVIDNRHSVNDNLDGEFATVTLLDNIDDFSLEYHHKQNDDWRSDWNQKNMMPARIKIQISQNNSPWPDIVIPIQSYLAIKTPFHVINIK